MDTERLEAIKQYLGDIAWVVHLVEEFEAECKAHAATKRRLEEVVREQRTAAVASVSLL